MVRPYQTLKSWKTPTDAQLQELIDNTKKRWASRTVGSTTVNGCEFAKSGDTTFSGDTLFIPAAGSALNGRVANVGNYSFVWTNSLSSSNIKDGRYLYSTDNGNIYINPNVRYCGYPVRGVVS